MSHTGTFNAATDGARIAAIIFAAWRTSRTHFFSKGASDVMMREARFRLR